MKGPGGVTVWILIGDALSPSGLKRGNASVGAVAMPCPGPTPPPRARSRPPRCQRSSPPNIAICRRTTPVMLFKTYPLPCHEPFLLLPNLLPANNIGRVGFGAVRFLTHPFVGCAGMERRPAPPARPSLPRAAAPVRGLLRRRSRRLWSQRRILLPWKPPNNPPVLLVPRTVPWAGDSIFFYASYV